MACGALLQHPNEKIRDQWTQAGINEFSRLTQGCEDAEGVHAVSFVCEPQMLSEKQAMHTRCVVDCRPEKDEPWQLRITCGGDQLECTGDTTTHSASVQLNDTVSTPGAKAAAGDISNACLASPLLEAEHVRFQLKLTPRIIQDQCKSKEKAHKGCVCARVDKA